MDTIPTLHTDLITLRPFAPDDALTLYRINQGEGVLRYFPSQTPPPLEKVGKFIAYQQEHWDKHGFGNWAIVPNGETEMVGWAGLQFLPELSETEVGYLMACPVWGKGYATSAARASIDFGFAHFDFPHIIGLVDAENLASRRVLEKCGMTYLETITIWGTSLMRHKLDHP